MRIIDIAHKRRNAIVAERNSVMELSYTATTSLNLRIETHSGRNIEVDWGDGMWISYASAPIFITKTFGSATSGTVRVRSAIGRGLNDLKELRITTGNWNFNGSSLSLLTGLKTLIISNDSQTGDMSGVTALTSLTDLYLNGILLTGNMSGVSALTPLTRLRLSGNFTGDMSGLSLSPPSLFLDADGFSGDMSGFISSNTSTYLYIKGDFTINYSAKTWSPYMEFFLFRPTTATNPLSTSELDQLLQDLAATTWTGSKLIYADGSNGIRSSASDAAVATLTSKGVTMYLNT